MAHWAELDEDNLGGTWKQASYTARFGKKMDPSNNWELTDQPGFRKNFPGPGYTYDEDLDAFIPPKPYPSWVFNEDIYSWDAPTPPGPRPDWDHEWDEDSLSWVER